jgi:hypothetical protein
MTGWEVHSVVGDQWYTFPNDYTLGSFTSVHIHSGPDAYQNPIVHLLWGYSYIWNNDGDEAILYNSFGQVIDSYAYSPTPQPNCSPCYPTICIPPPPPDLDCGDIPYRNFYVAGCDPHGFDGDNDGIGCES